MRAKISALLLCASLFLTGCKGVNNCLDKAVSFRNKLLESDGCSFRSEITADYGEKIYRFTMICKGDKAGNMTFEVEEPESISGICGRITAQGGAITFDDQILAFQTLADGQITPVSAPWVLIKTLRSGYIRSCTEEVDGFEIAIDDSYEENSLRLVVELENNIPDECEIFWKGRRILTVDIEAFAFL
jgi:hypothetical protein